MTKPESFYHVARVLLLREMYLTGIEDLEYVTWRLADAICEALEFHSTPESPPNERTEWDDRRITPKEVRALWAPCLMAIRSVFDLNGDPAENTLALSLSWSLHLLGRAGAQIPVRPSAAAASS